MYEAVLLLFAGILCGVVTGLLPGLHPNSVIFLLLPLYFTWQPPMLQFVAFTTGVSVVHTFVSFIPSIMLGAPDGDTALSVLPGHRYVQHGRGYEAIELTIYGGVIAAACAILTLPLLFHLVPVIYDSIVGYMEYVLLGVLLFMLGTETTTLQRAQTAGIMFLAGVLGVFTLNSPVANTQYILFPLFAGLFGCSTIVHTLLHHDTVPKQTHSYPVNVNMTARSGVYGFVGGILAGFLPGLGSSQSAVIVDTVSDLNLREFVTTIGGISTADLFLSLIALYVIGNPRSGAAVAIQQVASHITIQTILIVTGMAMVAVGAGALLTRALGRRIVPVVNHVPYHHLLITVLGIIAAGSYLLTGVFGILVLATATMLGITAMQYNVRKSYCMAVLIVPTILHYSGLHVTLF